MAIPRDPMRGLYLIRMGHGHEMIYDFVKETEMGHRSSLQVSASTTDTSFTGLIT